MGSLEATFALSVGSCERAFLVAEQFAFQKRITQGRAVDAYERPERSFALVMDQERDEFLARSTFPGDQNRYRCRGNLLGESKRLAESAASSDDLIQALSALVGAGGRGYLAVGQQCFQESFNDLAVQRLDEEIAAACLNRFDGGLSPEAKQIGSGCCRGVLNVLRTLWVFVQPGNHDNRHFRSIGSYFG